MAVDRDNLENVLKQLPEELRGEVFEFAESLLQKSRKDSGGSQRNGCPSVRAFFGMWDSGDPHSGDNDQIDADLAREYDNSHKKDSQ
jgi:Protein of unknown function (DUF2281)